MLPFERGQSPMHNDRSPAGVNDVATVGFAILPGLGYERESE